MATESHRSSTRSSWWLDEITTTPAATLSARIVARHRASKVSIATAVRSSASTKSYTRSTPGWISGRLRLTSWRNSWSARASRVIAAGRK